MGIIKAVATAVGGALADQWLEVMEPGNMGDQTVFTSGVKIRKGSNRQCSVGRLSDSCVSQPVYDDRGRRKSDRLHGGGRVLYG